MPDPVAWVLIEKGWRVVDANGEEAGKVDEVTGDENVDIFDGLTITTGRLSKQKYVPSEHVTAIREGEVVLDIALGQLETFNEPATEEQVIPESSTWLERLAGRLTGRDR
jgi:hypothetical protein